MDFINLVNSKYRHLSYMNAQICTYSQSQIIDVDQIMPYIHENVRLKLFDSHCEYTNKLEYINNYYGILKIPIRPEYNNKKAYEDPRVRYIHTRYPEKIQFNDNVTFVRLDLSGEKDWRIIENAFYMLPRAHVEIVLRDGNKSDKDIMITAPREFRLISEHLQEYYSRVLLMHIAMVISEFENYPDLMKQLVYLLTNSDIDMFELIEDIENNEIY